MLAHDPVGALDLLDRLVLDLGEALSRDVRESATPLDARVVAWALDLNDAYNAITVAARSLVRAAQPLYEGYNEVPSIRLVSLEDLLRERVEVRRTGRSVSGE